MTGPTDPTPDPAAPADPVVARLRTALDELTDGAEASTPGTVRVAPGRPRRWMTPTLAAAAAAVVVAGAAIAVSGGRDAGTPAAPTPTGAPVPTQPPPGTAATPWYELHAEDWTPDRYPAGVYAGAAPGLQVWVAPDYSRVLTTRIESRPDAAAGIEQWPTAEPLADPPGGGAAWQVGGDENTDVEAGVYWTPDATTAVTIHGYGFGDAGLVEILPALSVETTNDGPRVVSALSSLIPYGPASPAGLTVQTYAGPGDDQRATISTAADQGTLILGLMAPAASSITPTETPFGAGFRMTVQDIEMIWWPVDDGSAWAGLSAPLGVADGLLPDVARVGDIPVPAPDPDDDGLVIADTGRSTGSVASDGGEESGTDEPATTAT